MENKKLLTMGSFYEAAFVGYTLASVDAILSSQEGLSQSTIQVLSSIRTCGEEIYRNYYRNSCIKEK